MEYRPLKITVISAEGIKDMNLFSKQDVYTVVSIKGYKKSKKKTPVDKDCGTRPKWNHAMEFIVDEPYLTKPGLNLLFKIKAESALRKDKKIGTVNVPIHDLFKPDSNSEQRIVEYQVITESGQPKGTLKFSYCFGEKLKPQEETKKHATEPVKAAHSDKHMDEPMTAYPPAATALYSGMGHPPPPHYAPPPQAAYGGYPPQPSGYGYQPPPPGYGYPPPAGYGYPQAPPAGYATYSAGQKPKKKMGGMGLGMGLGAGLLGGLLIGDMVSDIGDASAYSEGYDDAMGDMGDF